MHLSASDLGGGAARAAYRLHESLRRHGEDSQMFVAARESDDPMVHHYLPGGNSPQRLMRLLRKEYLRREQLPYQPTRMDGCEHFRDDRSLFGGDLLEQMPHADIIQLHWVADFVDYRRFLPAAAATTPMVWTLHDMNPFTGGCHYDLGCNRYKGNCGACPQLGSNLENDLSRKIHQRKEQAFQAVHPDMLRIVAGSHWLADAARNSQLLSRFNVTTIHCGVDTEVFQPRDRWELRKALGIPASAFVVLFAADELHNRRKGLSHLLDALREINRSRDVFLLSVGHGSGKLDVPFPHIHLGRFTSDRMLSIFYSSGDCFVIPSLQEVFGLTALEAMACGTPVIGFNTGGIPDMVRPGKTGLLAPVADDIALARQITWMIDHPEERRQMGATARSVAEKEFSYSVQARRYIGLYEEIEQTLPTPAR
jgi:glycosyltransferase involved in cell wall biosynthesis